jgi:hypothetical protein
LPAAADETVELLIVHLYLVTSWTGTPVNMQPEEHSTIGWFSVEEANRLALADAMYPALFEKYI